MVAPLLEILCVAARLTDDPAEARTLDGAIVERLPWLLAFGGPQPHVRLRDIAIRHWDGYWFGREQLWGDVFPHHWSVLTANVLLLLPPGAAAAVERDRGESPAAPRGADLRREPDRLPARRHGDRGVRHAELRVGPPGAPRRSGRQRPGLGAVLAAAPGAVAAAACSGAGRACPPADEPDRPQAIDVRCASTVPHRSRPASSRVLNGSSRQRVHTGDLLGPPGAIGEDAGTLPAPDGHIRRPGIGGRRADDPGATAFTRIP